MKEGRKLLSLLFIVFFIPLFLQAQDVKLHQIHQEKMESARDTLALKPMNLVLSKDILPNTTQADGAARWPFYMVHRLDSTLHSSSYMKGITAGVMVYDLTADSVLYTYNEKQLLKPASNMKLFSGIAGLKELGPDYKLKTSLYRTGEIRLDTLYLQPDSLQQETPSSYTIRKVLHGNLMGVGSYDPIFSGYELSCFADSIFALEIDSIDGCLLEDEHFRYSYGVTPLQINKEGGKFMSKLKAALERRGIKCSGEPGIGRCTEDTVLVAYDYHTLRQVMSRMMKNSDNQYAENVYQLTNSMLKPVNGVKQLIQELGFNPNHYTIADGSGLSHDNRVSAELEVAVLRYAKAHEDIYSTLYKNLPIAGIDGTLSKRMQNTSAYGNVHAKTGTINGVITLAGYCTSATGHELAFAIMLNNIRSQVTAKALEDELCTIMTHDETFIPKKKVIVPKYRPVRRRGVVKRKRR